MKQIERHTNIHKCKNTCQESERLSTRENERERMGYCLNIDLNQEKVFISQLPTTWDVRDANTVTSLSQNELLSTKTKFWIDTLQLKRRGTQKWHYRS